MHRVGQSPDSWKANLAPRLVFLFQDSEGFAAAIAAALLPSPSSSAQRVEEPFQLPLDRYGLRDQMVRGLIINFIDKSVAQSLQVSVVVLNSYEPPVLACAVNEVLCQILERTSSTKHTFIAPFLLPSSKLKLESRSLTKNSSEVPLFSVQVGPETDISSAVAAKTLKAPPSLQIHYEPLACFLHLARVFNLPASILIGQRSQSEDLQAIYKIGELLESTTLLCLSKAAITLDASNPSRDVEEPWRALYG